MSGLLSGSGSSMYPEKSSQQRMFSQSQTCENVHSNLQQLHIHRMYMAYVGQRIYSEEQGYSLMRQCMSWEQRELSGMVKLPSQMATWLSPKGSVKQHSLQSRQPMACADVRINTFHTCSKSVLTNTHTCHYHCELMILNSPSHPNVRLCCDDLPTIEVDHLWSAV